MNIFEAMNELTGRAGIGRVDPDENGGATLLFDREHEVSFVPEEGDGVCFQCEIGDAERLGEGGCRALLEASVSATDGAAFAIHRALGKVVLWKRFGEFASGADLEQAINGFLGLVIAWKARLASGDFSVSSVPPELDVPGPLDGIARRFLVV